MRGLGATLLLASAACGANDPVGSTAQPIELGWHDVYYQVAPVAPPGLEADFEIPIKASGTVLHHMGWFGEHEVRGTCGVTFVTPSLAVTAAHCVDDVIVGEDVTVQMYTLAEGLDWTPATQLDTSLLYPEWNHPQLTEADGYVLKTYSCEVVQRCGYGSEISCECGVPGFGLFGQVCFSSDMEDEADVAILKCEGQPACTFDYVEVRYMFLGEEEANMVWAHEIYDVPLHHSAFGGGTVAAHYTRRQDDELYNNFHYLATDADGDNQLLPLVSKDFPTGEHTRALFAADTRAPVGSNDVIYTDILGCHGSSGSGVFTRGEGGRPPLLMGPLSIGEASHWDGGDGVHLCQDADPILGSPVFDPGDGIQAITWTHYVWQAVAWARKTYPEDPCPEPMMLFWNPFDRLVIPEVASGAVEARDWPDPWDCPECPAWARTRPYGEPMLVLEPGEQITVPHAQLAGGARYRIGFRARALDTAPISFDVYAGGERVAAGVRPASAPGETSGAVVVEFDAPPRSGPGVMVIQTGAGSAGVTEWAMVRDGEVNVLDTRAQRAATALLRPGETQAVPMRFDLGPPDGFRARLHAGERLLLTRLAMPAGRAWTLTFATDLDTTGMRCGVLFADGATLTAPCDALSGRASATLDATTAGLPLGLFIDLPATHTPVGIDDVLVTNR